MTGELTELLDTAIYKEIAAQAFYIAGQSRTQDPAAKALMKELAGEELKHSHRLKKLREKGFTGREWHSEKIPDLMISEYITGGDTLEGAGLQDTLIVAIRREQQSIGFYSRMAEAAKDESAKLLCARLVAQELDHKLKLEKLYDDLFYQED